MDSTNLMYEFSSSESNYMSCTLYSDQWLYEVDLIYYHNVEINAESVIEGDVKELSEVPFQVQIKYTSLDGQQCLRVFTEVKPTTSDKRVAYEGMAKNTYNDCHLCRLANFHIDFPHP